MRDPLGAMLDFRTLPELNEPVWPPLRWLAATILALGAGACIIIGLDTIRHPDTQPHPFLFLAFVIALSGTAGVLAVKLFRGDAIAGAARPPRPIVIRLLGVPVFIFGSLAALASNTWGDRIGIGLMALSGLGWLLWPRRFLPPEREHGA